MSWIREKSLTLLQLLAVKIIKTGRIPKHIAIIMDGNRRYAKKINSNKAIEGHTKGFDKLAETLQWCLDLGITEVTAYAFSIENFRRSKEEVDSLMDLIRQKLKRLLNEREKLEEKGVRIRILGNLKLLPNDVCSLIAEATDITKDNNKAFLNIALSYTSRDEITRAVKNIVNGVNEYEIESQDIDEDLINKCLDLDTNQSSYPELLIRTSGEVRLSDFLLWQTSNTYLHFVKSLWPEFSIWDLLAGIFHYQRTHEELREINKSDSNCVKEAFAHQLEHQRLQELLMMQKIEVEA